MAIFHCYVSSPEGTSILVVSYMGWYCVICCFTRTSSWFAVWEWQKNITNFWTPPSEAIRVCLNIVFYHKFMAFSCLHRVHSSIAEWEPPNSSHLKGKWWSINENSGIRGCATNCQVPMLYFMFKPPTSNRSPVLLVNRAMISRELLVHPVHPLFFPMKLWLRSR